MAKLSQTLYYDFIALVSLNTECLLFDLLAVSRFNFKLTNMSLQHIVLHEASTRSPQSHPCLNGLFPRSIELGQAQCKWIFQGSLTLLASFEFATSCQKIKVWYMRRMGYCSFCWKSNFCLLLKKL